MSTSNLFRRKQNEVLGLDNSSFISTSDDIASVVERYADLDAATREHQKKVRVISPHISQTETEHESEDDSHRSIASRLEGSRDYSRSLYDHHSPTTEGDNPFSEEEDEDSFEDDSDEDLDLPQRKGRRMVSYKANQALNVDVDSPWRNSTAMGNQPGMAKLSERDMVGVSAKAQKLLGMSKTGRTVTEEDYRRENSLSPETNNVAPKALRTLGIPSNPFKRPPMPDERSASLDDIERLGQSRNQTPTAHRPLDVDGFKRFLFSGHRVPPLDNSSSTDVSSLSRSSMASSQDARNETPRSSHEVTPEDLSRVYGKRPFRAPISSIFSKVSRSDSIDPAAVLTEPFSPMSTLPPDSPEDVNKPLPHLPGAVELPAHIPMTHYAPDKTQFIAELPASVPMAVAELPSVPDNVVELPDNELVQSPQSIQTSLKSPPAPPPARRTRSGRGRSVDHPAIPELSSFPVSPPRNDAERPRTAGGLSHAKTFPSMQSIPIHPPQPPPMRVTSLPKRNIQPANDFTPSLNHPQRTLSSLPSLTTNLPPTAISQPHTQFIHAPPPPPRRGSDGNPTTGVENEYKQFTAPATAVERPTTPTSTAPLSAIAASPTSPSSVHGLNMIAKAAISGARRKGSQASLASLDGTAMAASALRKQSQTNLRASGSKRDLHTDAREVQKDVNDVRIPSNEGEKRSGSIGVDGAKLLEKEEADYRALSEAEAARKASVRHVERAGENVPTAQSMSRQHSRNAEPAS